MWPHSFRGRHDPTFLQHRLDQGRNPLIRSEQDATRKHRPAQAHRTAPPQSPDAIILDDARKRLDHPCALDALRARLERIERLRRKHHNGTRNGTVPKRRRRCLRNVA